jgi:hypothetical protein
MQLRPVAHLLFGASWLTMWTGSLELKGLQKLWLFLLFIFGGNQARALSQMAMNPFFINCNS